MTHCIINNRDNVFPLIYFYVQKIRLLNMSNQSLIRSLSKNARGQAWQMI